MAHTRDMNAQESLQHLGLESKEIAIYLAVLELGEATVLEIAKKSGIKRPTAYVVLQNLETKGFVSKEIKGKKILFVPEHPKKLLTEAELKLRELKDVLPQLESLLQKDEDKPRVMIYEGKDQLDRAYDESFTAKGEVLYMSTLQLSQDVFKRTFRKMDVVVLSQDYRMRELVDDSEQGRKYVERVKGEYRDVRIIPKQFLPFEIDVGIFGSTVLVTSLKKEYFTVKLQSAEIAQAFRQLFEAMWKLSVE